MLSDDVVLSFCFMHLLRSFALLWWMFVFDQHKNINQTVNWRWLKKPTKLTYSKQILLRWNKLFHFSLEMRIRSKARAPNQQPQQPLKKRKQINLQIYELNCHLFVFRHFRKITHSNTNCSKVTKRLVHVKCEHKPNSIEPRKSEVYAKEEHLWPFYKLHSWTCNCMQCTCTTQKLPTSRRIRRRKRRSTKISRTVSTEKSLNLHNCCNYLVI